MTYCLLKFQQPDIRGGHVGAISSSQVQEMVETHPPSLSSNSYCHCQVFGGLFHHAHHTGTWPWTWMRRSLTRTSRWTGSPSRCPVSLCLSSLSHLPVSSHHFPSTATLPFFSHMLFPFHNSFSSCLMSLCLPALLPLPLPDCRGHGHSGSSQQNCSRPPQAVILTNVKMVRKSEKVIKVVICCKLMHSMWP